jgi:hypothetical protein
VPETKESDFIATARKRFQQAADDEKLLREQALIDLKFVAGEQWNEKLKQDRINAGRPAMVFNRCHTFVQQVSNEARQNKPQIKFAPGDDRADKDTAEVYEGMARAIQYASDAQVAYETAVEYSAGGSFGYFRFLTEEDEQGNQVLKIVPVLDPFAVYGILYPACFNREPRFGFVIEDMPKEEFESTYPDSPITKGGLSDSDISWMSENGWMGTETVRIAEYWYCEGTGKDIELRFCKISGMEVLPDSKTQWLDYCIPIFAVLGKQMIVQGKPKLFSVVRFQRDPQEMINYAKTRIAETLSVAPISPYMVVKGQIAKNDPKWETLNTKIYPYLEYNQVDVGGKPAPAPQRDTFEPPINALSAFVLQEVDDMKATAGIFDASLGQKSNETSGTAIRNRQQQSNMTTMHFMDNLERAYKKAGGPMYRLIRKIYDSDRMVQILGSDEAPKVARINAAHVPEGGKESVHYKVGGEDVGKYQVIVTMGRAFSTKRQESFDMMQQVIGSNPDAFPLVADLMFQNSDIAGSDIMAARFKRMLPPQAQDPDENDPEQQAQQLQAQNQQLQQHAQALNAYAQKLEQEKQGKVVETQGRVQVEQFKAQKDFELAMFKLEVQRATAEYAAKTQDARERMKLDADLDSKMHISAHELGMQAHQHAHDHQMADKQAAIASQQSDQQAANTSDQSAQEHAQSLDAQQQAAALQPAAENTNE